MNTPDEDVFVSVGENISKINNYTLFPGLKPYLIPRFAGKVGTAENWLYRTHSVYAYVIELCNNTWTPWDPDIVEQACIDHAAVNLYGCERAWTLEKGKIL